MTYQILTTQEPAGTNTYSVVVHRLAILWERTDGEVCYIHCEVPFLQEAERTQVNLTSVVILK